MPDVDLSTLVSTTAKIAEDLETNATNGLTNWVATWSTYFELFRSEFDSIRSTLALLSLSKYKDCFVILRSVFEYYFFFLLMVKGTRYRQTRTYRIQPGDSMSQKDARDKTFEKWIKEKDLMESEHTRIIGINKGHDDNVIHVTFDIEGPYNEKDVEKKGEITPIFYFVFEEYDPYVRFLAELKTLYRRGPSYDKIIEKHEHLHSQFLYIDRIEDNLKRNDLLTEEQSDRFRVHYNFLSSFTHPTRRGVRVTDSKRLSSGRSTKEAVERVILSYAAHFEAMLIRLMVDYFKRENPVVDFSVYLECAAELENGANSFWFIYNQPVPADIEASEARKKGMKTEGVDIPEGVLYYSDPILRMEGIIQREKQE